MGKINFSKEQENAISKRGKSLLVSAAAGSGKTAVLVERIIRKIIDEKISINELLVVTFTNAAASGMKEKIKKALKEQIKINKSDSFLRQQLYLTDSANISTVHSFCLNLIKKYSYLLDEKIPASFNLISDTEQALIKEQAVNEVISECYENDDEIFYRLTESYSGGRDDDKLISLILGLYSFLISIPDYRGWIENAIFELGNKDDFYTTPVALMLDKHLRDIMKSAMGKYAYALSYMEGDELIAPYVPVFTEEYLSIKRAYETDGLYNLIECINKISFANLNSHRAKSGADKEIPVGIRKHVKDEIVSIKEKYSNEIISAELTALENTDIIIKLFEIIKAFDERYKSIKYEKGVLDFNDLEHITIDLISDKGKLKEDFYPLRDSFNEIMVDEYQDTNDVQETIFNLLKKEDNLFTVGDVKQSIYRFRHANPRLFTERTKSYRENGNGEVISLNANYRCHENIVNTVNCIFNFIMTEKITGIDYEKDGQLICKGSFNDIAEDKLATEIKIARCNSDSEETLESVEAKMISDKIKEMVNDPDFIIEGRPVTYRDIVILVRSFNEKTLNFLNLMKAEGIPAVYDDKTEFFETDEIKNIIALLKITDNPYDDISLISVLRNIFDYSEDRLMDIRLINKKASFYQAFCQSKEPQDLKVLNYLRELKSYSLKYEINLLLEKIFDDTMYREKQIVYINGYKRKENLDRLCEIAREYEDTGFKGISSFVSYVEKIISGKRKLPSPKLNESDDAVRIMSIHKSKGLEFPVVILAGMHKKFNQTDLNNNVILSSKLGVGANIVNIEKKYKYSSVRKNIIAIEEHRELINEEMRVLYVALTRAKYKLIMSASIGTKTDIYSKFKDALLTSDSGLSYIDYLGFNCYLDMVMPPLFMHRSLVLALSSNLPVNYDFKLDFSTYEAEEKEQEESGIVKVKKIEDIALSDEEFEKIDKNASYRYVNPLCKIPKKISVSELKDVLSEGEYYKGSEVRSIYVPEFLGETNITASERGTLIHYIFEKVDLDEIKNSDNKLRVILDFIENNEYLKERLTLTDIKKAEAFFNHPIGIKMLRASKIFREKEFLIRMKASEIYKELENEDGNIIIQGIIDCLFVDTKGEVYLLDYKYVSKSEEEIRKTYTYQLELYREAVSKMLKVPKDKINTYIWNVRDEYLIDFGR